MSPNASGPAFHYYMIRGGSRKHNITVWETGTVDNEYIKTYGHYHIGNLDETYRVLFGEGVVLQQKLVEKNGAPQSDRVEEFKAIQVRAGDLIYMPPKYGHLVVNTGKTWLVTADSSPIAGPDDSASMPGHADYEMVRAMRGFAYYVVKKEGKPALAVNKLYKEIHKTDLGGLPVIT